MHALAALPLHESAAVDTCESPIACDLRWARAFALVPVVLVFPLGSLAVFRLGFDRKAVADAIAWTYSVGLFAAFTTAFWPLPGLRGWSTVAAPSPRRCSSSSSPTSRT